MRKFLKIFSLGVGLAMGIVLASKVCFEQTFDDFYDDADRIVYICEVGENNGQYMSYYQTSGGVPRCMAEYFPEVQTSTRFLWNDDASLMPEGTKDKVLSNLSMLADAEYPAVFTTQMVAGDLKSTLDKKDHVAVNMTLARKLYRGNSTNEKAIASELIGRKMKISGARDSVVFTLSAVYEDYPLNASYRPDMLVSLASIESFGRWDGRDNLVGNDSYRSFLKLKKGTDIEKLQKRMHEFCEAKLPMDEFREHGFNITFTLKPFLQFHTSEESQRNMVYILGFVAFALVITSVLNYLLAVVSTSVTRGKEMAVRKCYGAGRREVYAMMMREALLHTLLAVAIAVLLILAFRGTIEEISGSSLAALFSGRPLYLALGIVVTVTLVNGILPSEIFQRIPVAVAFKNYRENKRVWKLILLSAEFVAVAFLLVSLVTVSMQYNKVTNADTGFNVDQVSMISMPEATKEQKLRLISELRNQPFVADACFSWMNPFDQYSGNNVSLPGEAKQLFNVRDAYYVDQHYIDVMGLKLLAGRNIDANSSVNEEVLIDKKGADMLQNMAKFSNVIGENIFVSEHTSAYKTSKIVGVINNMSTGSLVRSTGRDIDEGRPMVMFFLDPTNYANYFHFIFVKYKEMNADNLGKVQDIINHVLIDQNAAQTPFKQLLLNNYTETKNTRTTVLLGGLITLLIALTGLIGYTIDEVRHRRKEIAVRRVNGALMSGIQLMFLKSIMRIALPTVLAGCLLALYAMEKWQEQFAITIGMPWWQAVLTAVFTLSLISIVTLLYVKKYAGSNPADSLRAE